MIFNITKDTPKELLLKKPNLEANDTAKSKKIRLYLDYGKKNVYSKQNWFYFDNDFNHRQFFSDYEKRELFVNIPDKAKTITVVSPYLGIIKDRPINIIDNAIHINCDDFLPMATAKCRVQITNVTGKEFIYLNIINSDISQGLYQYTTARSCDINGNFVLENMPPGKYYCKSKEYFGRSYDWIINVPDSKDYVFDGKMPGNVVTMYTSGVKNKRISWWLEDGTDKPVEFTTNGNTISSNEIIPVNGYLYTISMDDSGNTNGFYEYVSCKNKPGNITLNNTKTAVLTFTAPLNDNTVYPDIATITGTGPWQDVVMNMPLKWSFFSGLDCAIAQINYLAPGKWILKLDNGTGKIIEKTIEMGSIDQAIEMKL
jgi:hypothetical protein